jgi:Cu-processing system ATP-binding protein
MIKLININKKYGPIIALQNITLEIKEGSTTYIIGPNASGKTTLIKLLLGLIKPTIGDIYIKGIKLNGNYQYKENIGYMPQIASYPENLTVEEVFKMLKELRYNHSKYDDELVEKFNLSKEFNKHLKTLSGGTKQKVSASIAFLLNPEILILDEPTAGRDPLASKILKEKILDENRKGKTIIFTSHILSELEEMATDFIFLLDGKLIMKKSRRELKDNSIENIILNFMNNNETANQNN